MNSHLTLPPGTPASVFLFLASGGNVISIDQFLLLYALNHALPFEQGKAQKEEMKLKMK